MLRYDFQKRDQISFDKLDIKLVKVGRDSFRKHSPVEDLSGKEIWVYDVLFFDSIEPLVHGEFYLTLYGENGHAYIIPLKDIDTREEKLKRILK